MFFFKFYYTPDFTEEEEEEAAAEERNGADFGNENDKYRMIFRRKSIRQARHAGCVRVKPK